MSHDNELKTTVTNELSWEPSLDAGHIGVTARSGVVTLSGHVKSYAEKYAAETAAHRVKGVKGLAEELEVRLPYSVKRDDADIARAALDRMAWSTMLPSDAIKVKVEKGWVTLSGQVEWNYQKETAHNDVRYLMGVVGVSDEVTVKPKVNAANVSDSIEHALHRSWYSEGAPIKVSADCGAIKLTGSVHTWHDRQTAGATAWAAPGARSVENNISVM